MHLRMHLRTHIGSGSRQLQLLWQDASLDALEDLHAFEQMQSCIVSRMPATQDHPGFFLHFFRSDKCFATNQVHSCTKLTSVGFFTMCAKFPITQSPDIVWPVRKKVAYSAFLRICHFPSKSANIPAFHQWAVFFQAGSFGDDNEALIVKSKMPNWQI